MTATPSFLRPRTWLLAAASVAALGSLALQPAFADNDDDDDDRIKPAQIATQPLYSAMAGDRPAMMLTLSVEFPTVGSQYTGPNRDGYNSVYGYDPKNEYIGYYNHLMCYEYNKTEHYFEITRRGDVPVNADGSTGGAKCGQPREFSGNFLNWATSSSIDMMRMALSGGDRVIDEPDRTVLQRAWLPDDTLADNIKEVKLMEGGTLNVSGDGNWSSRGPGCFFRLQNYFPTKLLKKTDGGGDDFAGAVPPEMVAAMVAQNRDTIYVGNVANTIHFGVHDMPDLRHAQPRVNQTARCGYGPYNYMLGAGGEENKWHLVRRNAFFGTSSHTTCAKGAQCNAGDQPRRVWYGGNSGTWATAIVKGTFLCGQTTGTPDKHGDNLSNPVDNSKCYLEAPEANLSGDDVFYARVKVCDEQDVRDYGLEVCREYPSGHKKPIGAIQRHGDDLRLAAFGYANDYTAAHAGNEDVNRKTDNYRGRFGGVLRAPMKYVGQNTYSPTGVKTEGNPRAEWNPETGVFYPNPDKCGETGGDQYCKGASAVSQQYKRSGVINYLNTFGRNPSAPGSYKMHDPVDELYYEAMRYMQGLEPSEWAIKYLDDSDAYADYLRDGFPVYTDWSQIDPFGADLDYSETANYSCLRANMVVVGDVNTGDTGMNHDGRLRATLGTPSDTANVPDADSWRKKVLGFESGYAGGNRRLIALPGLAFWAHTNDIRGANWTDGSNKGQENSKVRPGLRLTTYTFDVNENNSEWGYSARSTRNQFWMAAKYGGFNVPEDYSAGSKPPEDAWTDGKKALGGNTNGATNPEPRTYYMPADPRGVLQAFEDIFSVTNPPGNRSIAGADSSGGLGEGRSFQAEFDGADWSGDVIAETIVVDGDKNELRAAAQLEGKSATRNIIMGAHDATSNSANTTAFAFTAANANRLPELDGTINGVNATAADRINWLRGDRSKEGTLRTRKEGRLLGDILNSGVKYVGAPAGQVNLGLGYSDFVDEQTLRTAAVYVGANDGMLHAFHAGGKEEVAGSGGRTTVRDAAPTLEELFAYIPSWMKGKLADLTDPDYRHQLYVDATPVIGDANLKADCTAATNGTNDCEWRSVLVGGTGGGGRGVYALDVTDPDNFTTNSVLWEFTDADDPDMGYVLGQARIVKLLVTPANTTTGTPAVYRWFAMVPAGVNNYVGGVRDDDDDDDDDDDARKGNGDANIFLLALDKAAGAKWTQGTNYWKLRLPRIEALQADYPTGILNLEAFTGLGGVTEYVYAGDLHGQLWAFAFKGMGSSDWTEMKLSGNYNNGTDKIKPLYIARTPADGDGNTKPQPITVAPTILEGAGNGVHFVSFGTGKYFEPTDAQSTKIDSFYTVYSNFNTSAEDTPNRTTGEAIIPGRNYLQEVVKDRTEDGVDYFKPSQAFFWDWPQGSGAGADNVRSGWYLDFVERGGNGATSAVGERQIADASWISLTSRLMFSTLTPTSATNTSVCGTGGGDSKLYTFDMISGMGTGRHSAVGMLAQPLVFLDTANTRETQADSTGRRLRISPVMSGQFGADGSNVSQVDTVIVPFGRLSWRRIDNFEGLRQEGGTSNPSAGGSGTGGGPGDLTP